MITVFSLINRRPKAHVSPSKNSKAMAPRAHDLEEDEQIETWTIWKFGQCFLHHKHVSWKNKDLSKGPAESSELTWCYRGDWNLVWVLKSCEPSCVKWSWGRWGWATDRRYKDSDKCREQSDPKVPTLCCEGLNKPSKTCWFDWVISKQRRE